MLRFIGRIHNGPRGTIFGCHVVGLFVVEKSGHRTESTMYYLFASCVLYVFYFIEHGERKLYFYTIQRFRCKSFDCLFVMILVAFNEGRQGWYIISTLAYYFLTVWTDEVGLR